MDDHLLSLLGRYEAVLIMIFVPTLHLHIYNLLFILVAASSILKALERQKVTGRPATVLHYYTVLIKVTVEGTQPRTISVLYTLRWQQVHCRTRWQ